MITHEGQRPQRTPDDGCVENLQCGSQFPNDTALQPQAMLGIVWKVLFPDSYAWYCGALHGKMTSISCVYNALCLTSLRPGHRKGERMERKAKGDEQIGREKEMRKELEHW